MTKPKMSREQFDHICRVLDKKGLDKTPENIVKYMTEKSNQKSKFYKPIFEEEAEKANQLRQNWSDYLMTIKYRFKFLFWHIVWHKKGHKGLIGRLDIVRIKK